MIPVESYCPTTAQNPCVPARTTASVALRARLGNRPHKALLLAHNLKVAGSNPAPAPNSKPLVTSVLRGALVFWGFNRCGLAVGVLLSGVIRTWSYEVVDFLHLLNS